MLMIHEKGLLIWYLQHGLGETDNCHFGRGTLLGGGTWKREGSVQGTVGFADAIARETGLWTNAKHWETSWRSKGVKGRIAQKGFHRATVQRRCQRTGQAAEAEEYLVGGKMSDVWGA